MGWTLACGLNLKMMNEDSELYLAHPEYAVKLPKRQAVFGKKPAGIGPVPKGGTGII